MILIMFLAFGCAITAGIITYKATRHPGATIMGVLCGGCVGCLLCCFVTLITSELITPSWEVELVEVIEITEVTGDYVEVVKDNNHISLVVIDANGVVHNLPSGATKIVSDGGTPRVEIQKNVPKDFKTAFFFYPGEKTYTVYVPEGETANE